jgi:hypothetical protein
MSGAGKPFARGQALTWILTGTMAAMLAVVGVETDWGRTWRAEPPRVDRAASKNGDDSVLPAFVLPPVDVAYKETVERPLFVPTRRPAPAGASGQDAMKKGQYKLTGTSINDTLTMVFLLETATGKTLRAAKGKEIVGTRIVVDSVDPSRVVLKQGEDTEELKLSTAPSPPRPVAPPPGQPGQAVPPGQPAAVAGSFPTPPGGFMPGDPRPPNGVGAAPPVQPAAGVAGPQFNPAAGSTMPMPTAQPSTQSAPPGEAAAQRRRRFQNLPPQ